MTNKLNDARRSLVRAKEAAETRLIELESERRETKVSIRSLEAAIKALAVPAKKPAKQSSPASSAGDC